MRLLLGPGRHQNRHQYSAGGAVREDCGKEDEKTRSRKERREREHEPQEVMWLTTVQNSSGDCYSYNTDLVSQQDSEPVELKFRLTNRTTHTHSGILYILCPKDDM